MTNTPIQQAYFSRKKECTVDSLKKQQELFRLSNHHFPSFAEWMPKHYTDQLCETISGACSHSSLKKKTNKQTKSS